MDEEYIKRDLTMQAIRNIRNTYSKAKNFVAVSVVDNILGEIADEVPDADVAPVVHGKWKATGTFKVADYNYTVVEQRCGACGHCSIRFKNKAESNYCPKCGAKMDEEANDDKARP